jgi:hypothetical protein
VLCRLLGSFGSRLGARGGERVMGSYRLGFDTRQLRFCLCSLCGGPEADGMRWAGEVREGWREKTSTDQCMPNGRQHRPNPEWVGGQNSESQGMERPVEVAREPSGRNSSTNSALCG